MSGATDNPQDPTSGEDQLARLCDAWDAEDAREAEKPMLQRLLERLATAEERARDLQNDVYRQNDELNALRRAAASGKNLEVYLDAIGREYLSGDYRCDLEKYWPYGPERAFPNWGIPITDLSDPVHGWERCPSDLYGMSHDELVEHIGAEIGRAIYYLLVICPRCDHGRMIFGGEADDRLPGQHNQYREVVRMWEFLYGHAFSGSARRSCKPRLDELDDQMLRAVAFVVEMAFENLC